MTAVLHPQVALQRAHQAYAAGDLAGALQVLNGLIAQQPSLAPARHLAAIVERRAGRLDASRVHFEAALRLTPRDPDLLNSYANLLSDLGDAAGARDHYRRALQIRPGHPDTLVNLALSERRLGADAAAGAALEAALHAAPDHVRAWQALGALRAETDDVAGAAAAFDEVLRRQPQNLQALRGRAQVEAELGGDAAPYYARALALAPGERQLALEAALAQQKAGEVEAAAGRLEALVAAHPDFAEAHAALSRLRWQAGDTDGFTRTYEAALAQRPDDPQLWLGCLGALMRADRPTAVLARLEAARPALGPLAVGLEAAAAADAGDLARADAAFARTDPAADPGLRLAYLRFLLRAGRPEAAAAFGQDLVERFADPAVWPYLATAWRLVDDARWAWLEGDPAFVQVMDLDLGAQDLSELAEVLRGLHRARRSPFDQTLRGGTQTDGALLGRREAPIARLRQALRDAVATYLSNLPPADAGHPLLGPPRDGFRFSGSWSVRLEGAGFHVNHVHSLGWISSAFYVALPPEIDDAHEAGWLTFGAPPAELGLALEPFRAVRPKPGRLALFPSTLWHGTRPFQAGERLTVAFDVAPTR